MVRATDFTAQSNRSSSSFLFVMLFTLSLLIAPGISTQSAWADAGENATEVGLGVASFVATLPYGAVKIAYASLGAIIGGFTYLLTAGDLESANVVWEKSLLGTYVLTPDHLKGDKQVYFLGPIKE